MGRGVGPEGDVVWIAQVVEISDDVREGVGLRVPAIEDEDAAARVVGEVVHARGEDAAVGRLREEAHTAQAAGGDVDV
jgi:hypothetical protein